MTTITFQSQGSRVIGFDVQGHSGYAEAGADIVCAAITSAVRLVETTVNDVLGLAASVKVRESDASISLRLPLLLPSPLPRLPSAYFQNPDCQK